MSCMLKPAFCLLISTQSISLSGLIEQKPEIVEKSEIFLFMPSIFSYFLTGEMVNDMTMAGTSMVTSLNFKRIFKKDH